MSSYEDQIKNDYIVRDVDEYQSLTNRTAIYPGARSGELQGVTYVTLGLVGESGEIAEKVKKIIRDSGGEISDEKAESIAMELGDVLWYAARLATELGFNLSEVMTWNVQKLLDRKARSVLGGSGDAR